jgi:transcription elongation GreA/GreB family factor
MHRETRFDDWITERFQQELVLRKRAAEAALDQPSADALAQRLARAVVVKPEEVMTQRVQFAAFVTVFLTEEGEEQSFQIVSDDEADPSAARVGASSPLARALFGAQEGDCVTVELQSGSSCEYEVTHISPSASAPWS